MSTAICPECESDVYVDEDMERGDLVTCEECGTDLEVVSIDPPEVTIYDETDEDFDDEYDEDDDFDDELEEDDDFDDDDDDEYGYDDDDEERY